jgi:hypothetical protein
MVLGLNFLLGSTAVNAQIVVTVCADDKNFELTFDTRILPLHLREGGSTQPLGYEIIFAPKTVPANFGSFSDITNGTFSRQRSTVTLPQPHSITVPLPLRPYPGRYLATIKLTNTVNQCFVVYDLKVDVLYPSSILQETQNDAIEIVGYGDNGGYIVEERVGNNNLYSYRWYHNGALITVTEAEERGYKLYLGGGRTLTFGDEYYVEITRSDGTTVRSCPVVSKNKKLSGNPSPQITVTACADDSNITVPVNMQQLPPRMLEGGNAQPLRYDIVFTPKNVPANFGSFSNITNGTFDAQHSITIPLQHPYPDHYSATVKITNTVNQCYVEYDLKIEVWYPNTILTQKFNNIIALVTPDFNGGHILIEETGNIPYSYQWFCNGNLITAAEAEQRGRGLYMGGAGCTETTPNKCRCLKFGLEYYVEIKRSDGTVVRSCSIVAKDRDPAGTSSCNPNL